MVKSISNQSILSIQKPVVSKIADMTSSELVVEKFTPVATKLIKKVNNLIEDTWYFIRKDKQSQLQPEYAMSTRDYNVVVKALYRNNQEDAILLDVSEKNSRILERFIIDRNAKNYTYEKILKTEHGSATVKTYNSKTEQGVNVDCKVNNYIENFFPKILMRNKRINK